MTTKNTTFPLSTVQYVPARAGVMSLIRANSRMQVLTYLFALLLGTGLYLEFFAGHNWNAGETVLLFHLFVGLIFTVLFLVWIASHIKQGLATSQRKIFTGLSWLMIAKYILIIATGWLMVVPPAIYLTGKIWFWQFETTYLLTFVHLWGALTAIIGLVVHLGLRHWRNPTPRLNRGEK
ncbi:hypothetical protein [Thalassospira sp. CH_XMU1448-2]|uniref:hypothetical protein n=1 Tax=Thalassospira sp. CH_XMU1448-2 TaxID=3107773 RepID=UPI00300AB44A